MLAVQRPSQDHQRYRRDGAEPCGQRHRSKPNEHPGNEGTEDDRDRRNPSVQSKRSLPINRGLIRTGTTGARNCALITRLRGTTTVHSFWVPDERLLNTPGQQFHVAASPPTAEPIRMLAYMAYVSGPSAVHPAVGVVARVIG